MASDVTVPPAGTDYNLPVVERRQAFVALGIVLLCVVALFLLPIGRLPLGTLARLGPGFVPGVVAIALAAVGLTLLIKGRMGQLGPGRRWRPLATALLVTIAALVLVPSAVYRSLAFSLAFVAPVDQAWAIKLQNPLSLFISRTSLATLMAPADYVSLTVLQLTVAVALAAWSRLAGLGMLLLGLLVGLIGVDANTGTVRLTFGLDALFDGVPGAALICGVLVAATALTGITSPHRLLSDARRALGLTGENVLVQSSDIGVRVVSGLMLLVAAHVGTFGGYDELALIVFFVGVAFGVACIFLGWNRWLFVLGLLTTPMLEIYFRRAMLLSRGSFDVFWSRPLSAVMLAAAFSIAAAMLLIGHSRAPSAA